MYEVIVLSSDNKRDCPFYRFYSWDETSRFIEMNTSQGWSCEVNYILKDEDKFDE